jgi:hypothetical protein
MAKIQRIKSDHRMTQGHPVVILPPYYQPACRLEGLLHCVWYRVFAWRSKPSKYHAVMRIKRGDCSHSVGHREVKSDAGAIVSKGRSVTVPVLSKCGGEGAWHGSLWDRSGDRICVDPVEL